MATVFNPGGIKYGMMGEKSADCCSEQFGEWIQTGYDNATQNSNLYEIGTFLNWQNTTQWNPAYTFGGTPQTLGNYGFVFGSRQPDCLNPIYIPNKSITLLINEIKIVEDLNEISIQITKEMLNTSYTIFNSNGQMISNSVFTSQNQQIMDKSKYPKGLYIIKTKDKTLKFKNL